MKFETKALFKKTWLNVILGVLLIIGGIIVTAIAFNNPADVSQTIAIVLAVVLFLMGIIALGTSLVMHHGVKIHSSVIYGSALIGVGVVLIILRSTIVENIITFLAVFLMAFGLTELINAIIMTAQKKMNDVKVIWIVLFYLLSAVTIGVGVTVLVLNLQNNPNFNKVVYIIVGFAIILAGMLEVISEGLKLRNETKQEEKKEAPKASEVTNEVKIESTTPVIEVSTTVSEEEKKE